MEFRVNRFQAIAVDVCVNLRRADIAVAQQFLHDTQVRSAADEVAGEAMTQCVR